MKSSYLAFCLDNKKRNNNPTGYFTNSETLYHQHQLRFIKDLLYVISLSEWHQEGVNTTWVFPLIIKYRDTIKFYHILYMATLLI